MAGDLFAWCWDSTWMQFCMRIALIVSNGILFFVSGYMFIFPVKNMYSNVNDGTLEYLYMTITPFINWIHIGFFCLSGTDIFKRIGTLSFCIVKIGSLYLIINSVNQLVLSYYYGMYYSGYKMDESRGMIYIPILVNIVLIGSNGFIFMCCNRIRESVIECRRNEAKSIVELTEQLNPDSGDVNDDDNENQSFLKNAVKMDNTHEFFGFYWNNTGLNKNQEKYSNILLMFVIMSVLWFIIYQCLCVYHHVLVLKNPDLLLNSEPLFKFGGKSFVLWNKIFDNNVDVHQGYFNVLNIQNFCEQFTVSNTMVFHRGFILTTVVKLLYCNHCKSNISISIAIVAVSATLWYDSFYIIKMVFVEDTIPLISLVLLVFELIIQIGFIFCCLQFYTLYDINSNNNSRWIFNIPHYTKRDIINYWKPRQYVWDSTNFNPKHWNVLINEYGLSLKNLRKNKFYCFIIWTSIVILTSVMLFENIFMITVQHLYNLSKWDDYLVILIYTQHLCLLHKRTDKLRIWLYWGVLFSIFSIPLGQIIFKTGIGELGLFGKVIIACYILKMGSLSTFCWGLLVPRKWNGPYVPKEIFIKYIKSITNYDDLHDKIERTQYKGCKWVTIYYFSIVIFVFIIALSTDFNCDIISMNLTNKYYVNTWNYFIIGGEPYLYSILFHDCFVIALVAYDAIVVKEFGISYDVSKLLIWCIIITTLSQLINMIIFGNITGEVFGVLLLLYIVFISFKIVKILHNIPNMFPVGCDYWDASKW